MYEGYYGFKTKPFTLQTDPSLLYMGDIHRQALSMLEYGLLNQAGFTVITGEIGSGKTTLLAKLFGELEDNQTIGFLTHTHEGLGSLLPWVLNAFGQDYLSDNEIVLYERFKSFLEEEAEAKRQPILVIDEAQNLSMTLLEELRTLSNVNFGSRQLIQLVLVGQPELRDKLQHPSLKQLIQRVGVDYHVPTLSEKETQRYISHRLRAAGRKDALFTGLAMKLIFRLSKGVPRVINVICDTVLSYAYAEELAYIDKRFVASVIKNRSTGGLLALGFEPIRSSDLAPEQRTERLGATKVSIAS